MTERYAGGTPVFKQGLKGRLSEGLYRASLRQAFETHEDRCSVGGCGTAEEATST